MGLFQLRVDGFVFIGTNLFFLNETARQSPPNFSGLLLQGADKASYLKKALFQGSQSDFDVSFGGDFALFLPDSKAAHLLQCRI